MANGFVKDVEKAGKAVEKAVVFLPEECVKIEHVLQDAITAEPGVKAGVIQLVKDVEDVEGAIAPLIGPNGLSITADLAAFGKLQKLFADFKAFLPVAEKVYGELKTDLS